MWHELQAAWTGVQTTWPDAWRRSFEAAQAAWDGADDVDLVYALLDLMDEIDQVLRSLEADLTRLGLVEPWRGQVLALRQRWQWLGAGIYPYVDLAVAVEGLPVAAAAGLVIGVGLLAYAPAAYVYAESLRDQARLLRAELDARIEAMRTGRTLPPSGFDTTTDRWVGAAALGSLLLLAGGAFALSR